MSTTQQPTKPEEEVHSTSNPTTQKAPSPKDNTPSHPNAQNFVFPPPPTCTSIPSSPTSTFHSPTSSNDIHISPTTTQPLPISHPSPEKKKSDKVKTFDTKSSSPSEDTQRHDHHEAVINDLCTILKRVDQRLQKIEDANERLSRSEKAKALDTVATEHEARMRDAEQLSRHMTSNAEAMQGSFDRPDGLVGGLAEGKGKGKEVMTSASASRRPLDRPFPSWPSDAGTISLKYSRPSWAVKGKGKEKEVFPAYTSTTSKTPRDRLQSGFSRQSSAFSAGLRTQAPPPTSAGSSSFSTESKHYNGPIFGEYPGIFSQDRYPAHAGRFNINEVTPPVISLGIPPQSFSSSTYHPVSYTTPNLFDPPRYIPPPGSSSSIHHPVSSTTPNLFNPPSFQLPSQLNRGHLNPHGMFPLDNNFGYPINPPLTHYPINSPLPAYYPLGAGCPPHGTPITHSTTGFTQPVDETSFFFNTTIRIHANTPFQKTAELTLLAHNRYLTDPIDIAARNQSLTREYLSGELSQQEYWNLVGPGSKDLNKILIQLQNPYVKGLVDSFIGRLVGDWKDAILERATEVTQEFVDFELELLAKRVMNADDVGDMEAQDSDASENVTLRGGLLMDDFLTPSEIDDVSTIGVDSCVESSSISGDTLVNDVEYTPSDSSCCTTSSNTSSRATSTTKTTKYRNRTLAKAYLSGRLTQEEYWNLCGPGFTRGHYLRQTPSSLQSSSPHVWESVMTFDFSDAVKEVGLSQEFVDVTLEGIAEGCLGLGYEMGSDRESEYDDEVSVKLFGERFSMATSMRGGDLGEDDQEGSISSVSPSDQKEEVSIPSPPITSKSSIPKTSSSPSNPYLSHSSFSDNNQQDLPTPTHHTPSQQPDIPWNDAATMLHILQDEGESPWPFRTWTHAWDVLQDMQRSDDLSGALCRFLQIREEGGERGEAVRYIVGEDV